MEEAKRLGTQLEPNRYNPKLLSCLWPVNLNVGGIGSGVEDGSGLGVKSGAEVGLASTVCVGVGSGVLVPAWAGRLGSSRERTNKPLSRIVSRFFCIAFPFYCWLVVVTSNYLHKYN